MNLCWLQNEGTDTQSSSLYSKHAACRGNHAARLSYLNLIIVQSVDRVESGKADHGTRVYNYWRVKICVTVPRLKGIPFYHVSGKVSDGVSRLSTHLTDTNFLLKKRRSLRLDSLNQGTREGYISKLGKDRKDAYMQIFSLVLIVGEMLNYAKAGPTQWQYRTTAFCWHPSLPRSLSMHDREFLFQGHLNPLILQL